MNRILLTGGTGLLGKALASHLASRGVDVFTPTHEDGDLRDPDFCKTLVKDVDHLFHLASFRRNVAYHLEHRDEVMAANIEMADALGEALLASKKSIPVTFFSTAILGTLDPPVSVKDIEDGYAAAKLHCEHQWKEICGEINSPLLIIRPASAYGPGDNFGENANVIPSLIKKCAESEKSFTVWGSGNQKRCFLYARDMPAALMKLIDGNIAGTQYLCPPELVTMKELAEMIRDIVKPDAEIQFDTSKPEGPSFPQMPLHPLLEDFPWTSLKKGLVETVDWYLSS